MSLERDTVFILPSDGYVIALKAEDKEKFEEKIICKLRYTISDSVLDGVHQLCLMRSKYVLKNLYNLEYLINVDYEDGTTETIKIWPVAVPSAVSFFQPDESLSPIVKVDDKLKVQQGMFQSASRLGDRSLDDASVALMEVIDYEILLTDGTFFIVKKILASDLASGDVFLEDPYFQHCTTLKGTVYANSAVGQSIATYDPLIVK